MAYKIEKPENWNGKTLILMQGFSRNMAFWNEHAEVYFNKGYRVFRYDPFNIGKTLSFNGVLNLDEGFSFHDDVAAVLSILKKENIKDKIHIVGHSLGAAKAIFLERSLNEAKKGSVRKLLIASPYIRFLSDYYDEQNLELVSSPLLMWNPFRFVPGVGEYVEAFNESVRGANESFVNRSSSLFSPFAIRKVIEIALNERSPAEETNIDPALEEAALIEVMKSLDGLSVLDVVQRVSSRFHLLTGNDEEATVPQDLIQELLKQAPESMTYKIIESDHFTPLKPAFYVWLNRFL